MVNVRFFLIALAALTAAVFVLPAQAQTQTPQAGGHVHYAEPPAQRLETRLRRWYSAVPIPSRCPRATARRSCS